MFSSSSTSRMRAGIAASGLRGLASGIVMAGTRQFDGECGPDSYLARDSDVAPVALEDGMHHGQAEARPLAGRLGRVERIEDVAQVCGRDAHPGVADLEVHAIAVRAPRAQEEVAAVRHRLHGVRDEV